MPVIARKLKLGKVEPTGRTEAGSVAQLNHAISKRIMELDDDVRALRERREWAWLPAAEIRQYSRLIKLLEATIAELQGALS